MPTSISTPTPTPTYSLFLNLCKQYNLSAITIHKSHIIVTQPYVNSYSTILEYNSNADKIFMADSILLKPNVNLILYISTCPFNKSKFIQLLNDYNSYVKQIKLNLIQAKLNNINKDL